MAKHQVAIVGCGPRGACHARAFLANADRFELAALCDINAQRLEALASTLGVVRTYADAEQMLAAEKPDVFCFATLPAIRLPLIELGIKHGVKAIAYEKPMATDLAEARRMRDACREAGVKTVVSHQQKYGPHWRKVKEIVEGGEIGQPHTIHATSKAWLLQLGTHLVDYVMWFNESSRGVWAIGQTHGKHKLSDSHPSPDYVFGQILFENGVRCILECGSLAPDTPETDKFWHKDAVTIHGSHGYARVVTGGGWKAVTKSCGGQILSGPGVFNPEEEQPLYIRELGDWLDDPGKVHCCNGEIAYHGFELVMALCLSSLERRKIDLPLEPLPSEPILERLRESLPDVPYEGER